MTSKQIFAACLFALPFAWGCYKAHKLGYLKPIAKGVGIGICLVAWFAFCLWLGRQP